MKESIAIISQLIEEHKTILQKLQTLEEISNDAVAIAGFEKARDNFMPGRFDQATELKKVEELVNQIDQGLQAHFDREETALLVAFEEQGDKELASAFRSLLLEHNDLRNRLTHTKNHLAQLASGELSRHHWEATAHDIRAHISHTRRLLEAHAEVEQELFLSLHEKLLTEK